MMKLFHLIRNNQMRNQRGKSYRWGQFILVMMPILLYPTLVMPSQTNPDAMTTMTKAIPPIDRAVPATYKTATFGLG